MTTPCPPVNQDFTYAIQHLTLGGGIAVGLIALSAGAAVCVFFWCLLR